MKQIIRIWKIFELIKSKQDLKKKIELTKPRIRTIEIKNTKVKYKNYKKLKLIKRRKRIIKIKINKIQDQFKSNKCC